MEKKLITRRQAEEQGLKRYFTGNPCPYGHIAERRVSSSACVECCSERKAKTRLREMERAKERAIPGARFIAGRCQSASK